MPPLSLGHKTAVILVVLTCAGAFARIYGLGTWDYYYDEIWHVYVAKQPTLLDVFHTNLIEDGHPPLLYFLWHYLLAWWNNPWMARLPALICGVLTIPMGYLLGKELLGSVHGGWFCAFFMAFSNLLIEQSDVMRGYTMMMLFCMIAIWSVYRYRDTSRLKYVIAYAFSISLALLCEFPAIPIAVFTGMHLLCSICRKRTWDLRALFLVGAINLGLMAYLLWFYYLLHSVGNLDFSQGLAFMGRYTLSPSKYFILHYVAFFLDYINQSGFFFQISTAANSQGLYILEFFLFMFAFIAGFVWLVRERRWWLLLLALSPIVVGVGLDVLKIVPLENIYCRRQIAMSISMMILFYGGFKYLLRCASKKDLVAYSPFVFTLAAAAVLCIGYAAYGNVWRIYRPAEFQESLDDTETFFSFLNNHVRKDDVIVTDWTTYFHFWNVRQCPAVRLSPVIMRYSCYDMPVYVLHHDASHLEAYRDDTRNFQLAMQVLDRMHVLDHADRIWIIGLQHRDATPLFLAMHFHFISKDFLEKHKEYAAAANEIDTEQQDAARALYKAAVIKKLAYAYPCGIEDNNVIIGGDDQCVMKYLLLAIPRKAIYETFIHHSPYHDPLAFLNWLQQDMEKR